MEFGFWQNIIRTFRCTYEGERERAREGWSRVINGRWKIILVKGLPMGFEPELWCTSGSCRTSGPAGTVERILFVN